MPSPSRRQRAAARGSAMPRLEEIYVAVRTRNVEDAETDDRPTLLVSRAGEDMLEVRLEGEDLERGHAALFRIAVADQSMDSDGLEMRLLAGGDDAWGVEHVIAWGI